jgi:hypothetical protein
LGPLLAWSSTSSARVAVSIATRTPLSSSAVVVQQGVRELLVDMGSPLFGPPRWAPRSYYLYVMRRRKTVVGASAVRMAIGRAIRSRPKSATCSKSRLWSSWPRGSTSSCMAGHSRGNTSPCAWTLWQRCKPSTGAARARANGAGYLVTHVFGEVNVMADAASKDRLGFPHHLSASLGVAAHRPSPTRPHLHRTCQGGGAARPRSGLHCVHGFPEWKAEVTVGIGVFPVN